jgi:hypothetical protein
MLVRRRTVIHSHRSWDLQVVCEYSEEGRLHRHRVLDAAGAVRFTTWEHNTPAHQHRLPNGAWTRPRLDLVPV